MWKQRSLIHGSGKVKTRSLINHKTNIPEALSLAHSNCSTHIEPVNSTEDSLYCSVVERQEGNVDFWSHVPFEISSRLFFESPGVLDFLT